LLVIWFLNAKMAIKLIKITMHLKMRAGIFFCSFSLHDSVMKLFPYHLYCGKNLECLPVDLVLNAKMAI
jgi:hypothetical protein